MARIPAKSISGQTKKLPKSALRAHIPTWEEFGRHIELKRDKGPAFLHEAVIYIHDSLETAWMAAQSIFRETPTPEVAIAL